MPRTRTPDLYRDTCLHALTLATCVTDDREKQDWLAKKAEDEYRDNWRFRGMLAACRHDCTGPPGAAERARDWLRAKMTDWLIGPVPEWLHRSPMKHQPAGPKPLPINVPNVHTDHDN